MRTFLSEAFKALDLLEEDKFDISKNDEFDKFKLFMEDDSDEDVLTVIDADAENEDEIEDSYDGKIICDCPVCHSKIFKDLKDIILNDDDDLANVGEECPYCYSVDGFKIIGEVAPFHKEYDATAEDKDGNPVDVELSVEDDDVKLEALKRRIKKDQRINESSSNSVRFIVYELIDGDEGDSIKGFKSLNAAIKFAEKQKFPTHIVIVPTDFDSDTEDIIRDEYGYEPFEVVWESADAEESDDNSKESSNTAFWWQEMPWDEKVYNPLIRSLREKGLDYVSLVLHKGPIPKKMNNTHDINQHLINRNNVIVYIFVWKENNKLVAWIDDTTSNTTHQDYYNNVGEIVDRCNQIASEAGFTIKNNEEFYKTVKFSRFDEALEKLDLETENDLIHVTAETKDEQVVPVDMDTQEEIEMEQPINDADLDSSMEDDEEIPEDEEIGDEADVEEFDEESFDELGESYLRQVYNNVKGFKTTRVLEHRNSLIVEGLIKFNSGNSKKTSFRFNDYEIGKKNNLRLFGENLNMKTGKKSFRLCGKVRNNKFLGEKLYYNYKQGKDSIRGVVRKK